jgi:ATP-dependent RNA helicase DDX51/DBP6
MNDNTIMKAKRKRDENEKKKKKKKKKEKKGRKDECHDKEYGGASVSTSSSELARTTTNNTPPSTEHMKQTVEEDAKVWSIDSRIVEGLKQNNIKHFFSIQRKSLPFILRGDENRTGKHEDVCVSAPTGSGKTLIFVISTLQMLLDRVLTRLRALVVLPSRDLAIQVKSIFDWFCDDASVDYVDRTSITKLSVGLVVGLKSLKDEQQEIVNVNKWKLYNTKNDTSSNNKTTKHRQCNNGFSRVDILVCTPGRLMDHIRQTPGFTLQHLRVLVVDEADRLMAQSYQGWVSSVLNAARGVQAVLPSRMIPCHDSSNVDGNNHNAVKYYFDSSTLPERQYDGTDSMKTLRILSGHLRKLLFSATLTNEPDKMVAMNLVNPRFISLQRVTKGNLANDDKEDSSNVVVENGQDGKDKHHKDGGNRNGVYKFHVPDGLTEHVVISESRDKPIVLFHLLEELIYKGQRTLVFVSSVESTHRLCTLMKIIEEKFDPIKRPPNYTKNTSKNSIEASVFAEYSSRLTRSKRSIVLQQFREAKSSINVLICSDAMARGLDIDLVDNVINYDLPMRPETYIHRVGRAARAGRSGSSYTFLKPTQMQAYKKLIEEIKLSNKLEYEIDSERLENAIPKYSRALKALKDRLEYDNDSVGVNTHKVNGNNYTNVVEERKMWNIDIRV